MKLSDKGLQLIKDFEGFEGKAYLCPAGVPTIGYGATYYPKTNDAVLLCDEDITEHYASVLLQEMVGSYERGVMRYVTSKLSSNQFDALVSFAYNVGLSALKSSTLLKRVNANPCDENIAYQFSRWNKANGKVLKGLTKRRKAESDLYYER